MLIKIFTLGLLLASQALGAGSELFGTFTQFGDIAGLSTELGGGIPILAQAGLEPAIGKVLNVLRIVTILFAVIGVVYAGIQLFLGNISTALFGLLGAGLMAIATVIVNSLYDSIQGGITTIGL